MSTALANDIRVVPIEEEMKRSYLDYAMSVIVSRALPDVRDGLKPVHRRILYAMKEAGNDYNKPHRKSARVVGEVMGKFHPHGNMPIYDAMVRLTQDFSLRLPLIDGQGNFGSMDGDSPAAERYTEARLSEAAHTLLVDIDQDTVDFQMNYDDTLEEPKVLPARFPNLLVNGSNGIAVGMATYIPTHNLGEVIDACLALIDNSELTYQDILRYMPGPDFPTGGIICGRAGIVEAFRTGRGSVVIRGKTNIEQNNGRDVIVVEEIPFQVNKARMIEKIADLVKEKVIEGISDLRDESSREGVRVVIEVKRDANAEVILNQLYKFSPLQTSISYNMLALHHGRPQQMNIQQMLAAFVEFREEVIIRRTRYDLRQARDRAHLLVGFALAVAHLDPVIELIRASQDRATAKEALMARRWAADAILPMLRLVEADEPEGGTYALTEAQAQAILDLRLHRLTGMERQKILNELDEVVQKIQDYLKLLGSREALLNLMKQELAEIKEKFANPRRTTIEEGGHLVDMEDLIEREDMVVTFSFSGYVKRVSLDTYRSQRRGGRGRTGMSTHDEDAVRDVVIANTHDLLYFFTSLGRVYTLKGYRIPEASPQSKGRALINLLPLAENETVSTVLLWPSEATANTYLMFSTSKGNVRRNRLADFESVQSNGKKAIVLDTDESLIDVALCTEDQDVLLTTAHGICNRFHATDVRVFAGRDSNGVRGIRLQGDDKVVGLIIVPKDPMKNIEERDAYLKQSRRSDAEGSEEATTEPTVVLSDDRVAELASQEVFILTLTNKGLGKRTSLYEYRTTQRGSQGFVGIDCPKGVDVVASAVATDEDEMVLVSNKGQILRCPVSGVRFTGRRAKGVIIARPREDETIMSMTVFRSDSQVEEQEEEDSSNEQA